MPFNFKQYVMNIEFVSYFLIPNLATTSITIFNMKHNKVPRIIFFHQDGVGVPDILTHRCQHLQRGPRGGGPSNPNTAAPLCLVRVQMSGQNWNSVHQRNANWNGVHLAPGQPFWASLYQVRRPWSVPRTHRYQYSERYTVHTVRSNKRARRLV